MDDIEEYKALSSCLSSFYEYGNWARHTLLKPKTEKWNSLLPEDQALLPWYPQYLQDIHDSILVNENFLRSLAVEVASDWGVPSDITQWYRCNYSDFDKVRSTLKQLVREWSKEGVEERQNSFEVVLQEVDLFAAERGVAKASELEVLVTGCGLGRLVLEFVKRGYRCQGNEFSYHMLLLSSYMLNHMNGVESHAVCPFIHKASHQVSRKNMTRKLHIPDMNPLDIFKEGDVEEKSELMSMCAGSFTDLYGPVDLMCSETYTQDLKLAEFRKSNASKFDVVVTCFFLDTASNIVDYLKTVRHCLSENGIWINFGPLLWHFEDDDGTMKVIRPSTADPNVLEAMDVPLKGLELTREDLHDLCETMGFEFVKYQNNIPTTYSGDPKALAAFEYKCEYWVCKKKT